MAASKSELNQAEICATLANLLPQNSKATTVGSRLKSLLARRVIPKASELGDLARNKNLCDCDCENSTPKTIYAKPVQSIMDLRLDLYKPSKGKYRYTNLRQ